MPRRYSTIDIEIDGVKYEERIIGKVDTSLSLPEFVAGIEFPQESAFTLNNRDKAITNLRKQKSFRGKKVIVRDAYILKQLWEANKDSTAREIYTIYRGIVSQISDGLTAEFRLIPQDIDILDTEFPVDRINTTDYPDAIDLDFAVPYVIGTAKKVPLALIKAQESPTVQYQYLVGRGDLTIDVVYRDDLVIKEYTGTAQAGNTSTTIKLQATDTKADDFYNDAFILITGGTGAAQVRKITDYVSSTKVATVDSAWTTIPDNTSTYVIREWKKITLTVSGVTYTGIEFAIPQRDRDQLFQRDRMAADVTGLQAERNPAKAVESILKIIGAPVDSASFTVAKTDIDNIGGLVVDGAAVEPKKLLDVLLPICLVGRLRLRLNSFGQFEAVVDGTQDVIKGAFSTHDNVIDMGAPRETPLESLIKNLRIRYRKQFNSNEYRLITDKHDVVDDGKIEEVLENDWLFDKTAADKTCDYLAKRKKALDVVIPIRLGHEARGLMPGDLIDFMSATVSSSPTIATFGAEFGFEFGLGNIDIEKSSSVLDIDRNGIYQIIATTVGQGFLDAEIAPYDDTTFVYTAKTLPTDPVTDSTADFRKTPPDAVTNLSLTWQLVDSSYTATAKLSWTNPTQNFKQVLVEYKKSADALYNTFTITSGTNVEIPGLTPGLNYDFRFTSINQFDLQGGVASLLNQLAPGDATAPSTPTGLAGPTTSEQRIDSITWKWNKNPEADIMDYHVRVWTASTGGTKKASVFVPADDAPFFTFPVDSGDLATAKTFYAEVAARDFSRNKSAFTARVAGSTRGIVQGDIVNNEIIASARFSNTATTTTSPIASVTLTLRGGQPVEITFTGFLKGSAGLILGVQRNGNVIYQDVASGAFGPAPIAVKFTDASPPSGNTTYNITAGNIPTEGISNRNLVVKELRR